MIEQGPLEGREYKSKPVHSTFGGTRYGIKPIEHKIVIVEGRDRIGKSTCIQQLKNRFKIEGYKVIEMYGESNIEQRSPWKTFYKDKKINDIWQFGGASFEVLSYMLENLFKNTNEKTVVVFDRLTLSNLAYGMSIRRTEFDRFWGGANEYLDWMNVFETTIGKFCTPYMITCVSSSPIKADDTDNDLIHVTAEQINIANKWFAYSHMRSVIENKLLIQVTADDVGYYNTNEQWEKQVPGFIKW